MNFLEKMFSPLFTGIFSRKIRSKIVRNGNTCCVIWSEPDVPAAYSGVPFLTDVLAVPFFAEEACGMGAHIAARESTIFSRKMSMRPANRER
jgi:hypothetical protein